MAILGIVFLACIALFLTNLGQYAFWDDEAVTALGAKGVLRTGWTSVLMDYGNIVAYRGGVIVSGFCDRVDPPLEDYVTAAFFALFGENNWTGRLPYALMGLGAVALMLAWVRNEKWHVIVVLACGILGNVSLILYCRQCRYYAMSILLSTAIVFIYWRWKPTPKMLLLLSGLSALLFASNYLQYLALYLCLAVDYAVWKRKKTPLGIRDLLILLGPQAVVNAFVGAIWNPLHTQYGGSVWNKTFLDKLTLWYWYWRDTNEAEFFCLPVLALALILGLVCKKTWLVRGCVALGVYLTFITISSPQPVATGGLADIRYACAAIPIAIALEAGAICTLLGRTPWLAVGAAALVFGTNLVNGGPLLYRGLESTIYEYVGELMNPLPEPYTPAANWVRNNVAEGQSVWVQPDYSTYPLMWYAPRALYAWQLDWPPRPDFAGLPRINFKGQEPPDYVIAFGPFVGQAIQVLQGMNRPELRYVLADRIPVFWHDMYRPELFWRTFTPITGFDLNSQAIFIFKRTNPPIVTPAGK